MKNVFVFLGFIVLTSGCISEEKAPIPNDVLAKEQMVEVLVSIHIAESYVNNENMNRAKSLDLYKKYEKEIFQKYQIDSATYFKSYDYYLDNIELMKEIYVGVVDTLTARKEVLNPSSKLKK